MLAWVDRGLCEVDECARLPWCAWCTWLSCVFGLGGLSYCGKARFELETCVLRHGRPIIFSLPCLRGRESSYVCLLNSLVTTKIYSNLLVTFFLAVAILSPQLLQQLSTNSSQRIVRGVQALVYVTRRALGLGAHEPLSERILVDQLPLVQLRQHGREQPCLCRRFGAHSLHHTINPARPKAKRTPTWNINNVSASSYPPICFSSAPHLASTFLTSALASGAPSPSPTLPTINATTASFTRGRGTLLAIRNVLSSIAALSTVCPSSNARVSD